jgi:hypothetical protein
VKIPCLIALFFFITFYSNGQAAPPADTSRSSGSVMDSIYAKPEKAATLKKGNWLDFLQNHMIYPQEAMR